MEGFLNSKVAIVTGAAQSIGAGIARALHRVGASVIIADIADTPGQAFINSLGTRVLYVHADVSRERDIQMLVQRTADAFGGIDILVNNAVNPVDGGLSASRDTWLASYATNVVGPVLLIRAVQPWMQQRGGGTIINIASVSGHRAQAGRWVYNASKAALLQVTRSAARDLGASNIRVMSITPGWTRSRAIGGMTEGGQARADQLAAPYNVLGRAGSPEDIGTAVAFLASDDAGYITGAELAVDGGYLALGPEQ